jgi:anti-sigma B factor antagonist
MDGGYVRGRVSAMATSFRLQASTVGARAVLALTGSVDLAAVGEICDAAQLRLDDPAVTTVLADLAEVSFVDSSGIGALVRCWRQAQDAAKTFRIVNARDRVRDVLELTNVLELLSGDGSDTTVAR